MYYNNIESKIECSAQYKRLPEQYKTNKFLKLYIKIYEYMLSVPKEKIVVAKVKNGRYIGHLFSYIFHFIGAKDFYHWKNRIYSLLTEKVGNVEYRKFELYYNSKAKEFFDRYINKILEQHNITCLAKYGRVNVGGWLDLSNTSKEADEICEYLDNILSTEFSDIYYSKKNKEYRIGKYRLDFCIPSIKLGVEYDGSYWHGYNEGQELVPYGGQYITVEERHKKDQEKSEAIEKAGYKLFRINSIEYLSNKSKCLENLVKEIKEYVHSIENRL